MEDEYDYITEPDYGSTYDSGMAELSTTGNYEYTDREPGVYGDDTSGSYFAVSDTGEQVPMTKEQFDTYNQDPNSFDWKQLGKSVSKALPQVLSIGTNIYGSYRADQLARGYEKAAKDYTKKGEDLISSNLEYTKGKQTLYEQQMQEAMGKQDKAMDLTLANALRTEKLMNNWTSVFGGVEDQLSNYYNNLDEDTLATFRVNEINQQVAKSKQSLAQVFAQRGLASSGAEAEAMLNLEFSSAYKKADSIYQSKLDTIKQKEDWYKTGQVNQSNLLSANGQSIGQYGQLASSQTAQYGTLANNSMVNTNSASNSAINFYGKQADYNYTQAGNMNAAAYGMAQNVGQSAGSSGSSSGSKDSTGKTIGTVGGTIVGSYFGMPTIGAAVGGMLGGLF